MARSAAFEKAVGFILPHETEFARGHWGDMRFAVTENVAGDNGGLTKFGIDQRSHPQVDIASLTQEGAEAIYYQEWLQHRLDLLPERLAIAAFDVYVNGGYPGLWLQQAFNKLVKPTPPLVEDGVLGPKSLIALTTCDQTPILREFFRQRNTRFEVLARKVGQAKFLDGWLVRDKDLEKLLQVA